MCIAYGEESPYVASVRFEAGGLAVQKGRVSKQGCGHRLFTWSTQGVGVGESILSQRRC